MTQPDPRYDDPVGELRVLRARLRAEEKKLALVQEIGRALSSATDLDRLLSLIVEKITVLMEADRSTMFLVTDEGGQLWSKVLQGGELMEIRLKVGEGIAGWVAGSGETVNIPDAYKDDRFQPAMDQKSGYRTRSILCMPMTNPHGHIVGVVQTLNKKGGPFTADDEHLLAALGSQAAVAIENSKLYQNVMVQNRELVKAHRRLEQNAHELNMLLKLEQQMNIELELDALLDRLLERARETLNARVGRVILMDQGSLQVRTGQGRPMDDLAAPAEVLHDGLAGWVAREDLALAVSDPARDERCGDDFAGSYRPTSVLCAPLPGEEDVLGVIQLMDKSSGEAFDDTDTTLLSLVAGQVARAVQLARAKEERMKQGNLAAIGQMLSGVLHDLKTPMTIVSGYAQLMAANDDAAEREAYVEHILKQFEQMASMTREVLAFAKGEINVFIRRIFLHKFLAEVQRHLEHEFASRGVTFELDAQYRSTAYFDEQKMLRVIHNLARNAAQAMGRGGKFRMVSRADGDRLVFEFHDTGPGIPPEMEGRLFELFATSGKKDGTGLGLAIVKKIVDEHDGDISYESRPGQGTTFTISLPLERQENA